MSHDTPPVDLSPVLAAMREGLQIVDQDWRYVWVNPAAAAHGRRTPAELVGRTMMECYPGIDQTPMFARLRECLATGESVSFDNEFRYPNGQTRTFELRVDRCALGLSILSIDVTDGRRLEQQLRHAQKMEAIGRLAGSVAHDFNNLLTVILSYSTLALEELKPVDPLVQSLRAIHRAGERAADLTRQLLAFSRQQVMKPKLVDLNAAVADAERMLRRLLGEDVELATACAPRVGKVLADPGHIDQVLMNLAINARDAMPAGGKLTIETREVTLDEAYAREHFDVTPGRYVMLGVSDTGVGMDREVQSRIFEPFFTTKEVGKGTGLGLSTVFGIVRQSKGTIWVYSEPGAGTTFKVYLPVAEQVSLPDQVEREPATLTGTETVLIAEDQDEVLEAARHILRRYGYHVLAARNAGEALLTCERHPRTIHLLLTDVVMPQMNGAELAERLRRIRPEMRVLFMSGYTETGVIGHGILDSGAPYIQKPLEPEQLARKVRTVLDAP